MYSEFEPISVDLQFDAIVQKLFIRLIFNFQLFTFEVTKILYFFDWKINFFLLSFFMQTFRHSNIFRYKRVSMFGAYSFNMTGNTNTDQNDETYET